MRIRSYAFVMSVAMTACDLPESDTTGDLAGETTKPQTTPPVEETEPEPLPERVRVACGEDHNAAVEVGVDPGTMPIPRVDAWQVDTEGTWQPLTLEGVRDGELTYICVPEKGDVTAWIWP